MKTLEIKNEILKIICGSDKPVTAAEISKTLGLKARWNSIANMNLLSLTKEGFVHRVKGGYIIAEKGREALGFPKIDEQKAKNILRALSMEEAFQFFTGNNQPLGMFSFGLIDLAEKIRSITLQAIQHHWAHHDFETWIHVLGDFELERRVRRLREDDLTGEALRGKLYQILRARYVELLSVTA